jgi:hypothetical protein
MQTLVVCICHLYTYYWEDNIFLYFYHHHILPVSNAPYFGRLAGDTLSRRVFYVFVSARRAVLSNYLRDGAQQP